MLLCRGIRNFYACVCWDRGDCGWLHERAVVVEALVGGPPSGVFMNSARSAEPCGRFHELVMRRDIFDRARNRWPNDCDVS